MSLKRNPQDLEMCTYCRVKLKWNNTRCRIPFRNWCRHCVRAKGKESPHHESSLGGVSKFGTDFLFIGEDGTPSTFQLVMIERANQTIQGQIRAIMDYTERQIGATIGLDSSVLKWLARHAAWTLATFHVGFDGTAFGAQILFKPHTTTGPQQKLAVNWLDGCWLGFNTRTV